MIYEVQYFAFRLFHVEAHGPKPRGLKHVRCSADLEDAINRRTCLEQEGALHFEPLVNGMT